MRIRISACLLLASLCTILHAREDYEKVFVVPAPGAVTVDGDLSDWDESGFCTSFYDQSLLPNFRFEFGFMYDAEALYVGAHFYDETPLVNAHDPRVEPRRGWAGDALQVRVHSDPAGQFPLTTYPKTSRRTEVSILQRGFRIGSKSGQVPGQYGRADCPPDHVVLHSEEDPGAVRRLWHGLPRHHGLPA